MVDVNWHLPLHYVGLGYLHGYGPFHGNGVGPIHWDLHPLYDGHPVWNLNSVWHWPVYVVGNGLFDANGVGLGYMHWVGPVNWNSDGHWHLSLNGDWVGLGNGNGVGDHLVTSCSTESTGA